MSRVVNVLVFSLRIPFENEENALIKRCPLCHVPIERNDGCAQMMCQRCNHVFCWFCLASLDVSLMMCQQCNHVFCWFCLASLDVSLMMCQRCNHVFCWFCLASLDVSLMMCQRCNHVLVLPRFARCKSNDVSTM